MKVLYYADLRQYKDRLQKLMPKVPQLFVLVFWPVDKSYCILGTDNEFNHWEDYTNYTFKELQPALELPDTIFRLPDDFEWIKV